MQEPPLIAQPGHARVGELDAETRDGAVDAGRGDREVVGVGDHCGLEAEVDGGDIEVRPVDQEQEELVRPQDAAQNESPSGVGGEGPQGHSHGMDETAQRPPHEKHLADQARQRRQEPDRGRGQQGDRVGDPAEGPAPATARDVGDDEGLDEEHVHQCQHDMGAQRRRRPAGGDRDQSGHHQDRGRDQHEQSRPHAREAAGGAVVAPVRDVADKPVDGRAGDLAEPRHGHGDADDQGEQRNAPDAVAAELGAHDRVAGPQEDGGRHGLQHAPRRRGPRAGGAIPRPADRHGRARAQAHRGDPGEGNSGGRGCELLGAADRRARRRRGDQHQRRGHERDESKDDGRARCAQERQNDHRFHGRRRQED